MKVFKLIIGALAFISVAILGGNSQAEGIQLSTQPKEPVALFVQVDPNGVGKPTEITERIFNDVAQKLATVNKDVIPMESANKHLRTYIRDTADAENLREQDKGMILRSKDYKALAKKENVRYVVSVNTRVTSAEEKMNMWTGIRKNLTILTDIVVYDTEAEDYTLDEEFSNVGKTSGSYDRAFSRAVNEALNKVDFTNAFK